MMTARANLTDEERFPLASESGRSFLERLRQHPHAPRYNMRCGDRLTPERLEKVAAFEEELRGGGASWAPDGVPEWVIAFARRCLEDVPIYRRRGGVASEFASLPTIGRDDLAREPWSFVPDGAPLDDLIVYYTSGTGGRPMDVLSHPEAAAKRIPLFRAALAAHGAGLDGGGGRVAIAFICSQKSTLTYAGLSTYLGEAGNVKINLDPGQWRDPGDRVRFLDECRPEIFTGDPLSFSDLADLPIAWKPRAMISSAMTLLPGARRRLEERFECPVVDLYSTCETGPIAHAVADGRHRILPRDVYVEILDAAGRPCPPGARGEIAVTGGRNPFFPMLRYRTGDRASLELEGGAPTLVGLEGRAPVVFVTSTGGRVNNIDVTTVLRPFALPRFSLHQNRDASLVFRYSGPEAARDGVERALQGLFGGAQKIVFLTPPSGEGKWAPYSSDLTAGAEDAN